MKRLRLTLDAEDFILSIQNLSPLQFAMILTSLKDSLELQRRMRVHDSTGLNELIRELERASSVCRDD